MTFTVSLVQSQLLAPKRDCGKLENDRIMCISVKFWQNIQNSFQISVKTEPFYLTGRIFGFGRKTKYPIWLITRAVHGGNKLVAEGCLKKSGAQVVRARVTRIKQMEKGRRYEIEYAPKPDLPPEKKSFDIVIIATPLTEDKSDIQFENLQNYANLSRATDPQLRWVRLGTVK